MYKYKVFGCNHPPDGHDLEIFSRQGWELVSVCPVYPDDECVFHLENIPANSEMAKQIRYTLFFKRHV